MFRHPIQTAPAGHFTEHIERDLFCPGEIVSRSDPDIRVMLRLNGQKRAAVGGKIDDSAVNIQIGNDAPRHAVRRGNAPKLVFPNRIFRGGTALKCSTIRPRKSANESIPGL